MSTVDKSKLVAGSKGAPSIDTDWLQIGIVDGLAVVQIDRGLLDAIAHPACNRSPFFLRGVVVSVCPGFFKVRTTDITIIYCSEDFL